HYTRHHRNLHSSPTRRSSDLKETNSRLIRVPQQNDFKKNNLAVAKECVAYLHQCARLEYPSLPARQEMFGGVMLDGAHNENGAQIGRAHVCTPVTFRSRMPSS